MKSKIPLLTVAAALLRCCYAQAQSPTFSLLHTFNAQTDGAIPYAALIQASDGNLYGTASEGKFTNNDPQMGTVFRISLGGTFTTLYTFHSGAGGQGPYAPLLEANDGNFYGATQDNCCGDGTIFRITPSGSLTTVYKFTGGLDGRRPSNAGLAPGSDGNYYGTTFERGKGQFGTAFRLTPTGALTTLYSFDNGAAGGAPDGGLIEGSDGNFYGVTTSQDFPTRLGSVFRMTPNGDLTTLRTFTQNAKQLCTGSGRYCPNTTASTAST